MSSTGIRLVPVAFSTTVDFKLLLPSAIFDGIETADRLICDSSPCFSSFGKVLVSLSALTAISNPLCQILSCLKFLIKLAVGYSVTYSQPAAHSRQFSQLQHSFFILDLC